MMIAVFAIATVLSAAYATVARDTRRSVLALWLVGLGVGAIYLALGAELLAIIQWVVSTLVAISFIFFSAMFGEQAAGKTWSFGGKLGFSGMSILMGAGFVAVIWLAGRNFPGALTLPEPIAGPGSDSTGPARALDLLALGGTLVEDHIISLEALALMLFLVLIGSGVIARPEKRKGLSE